MSAYFGAWCFCFLCFTFACFTFACFLPAANALPALPSRSVRPSITLNSFRTDILLVFAIFPNEMTSSSQAHMKST